MSTTPVSQISSAPTEKYQPINIAWTAKQIVSKIEAISSIVAGILFLVSGVLLLTLAIPALPAACALALGIVAVAVGSALASVGVCRLMPQLRVSHSRQTINNLMETLISRERTLAALVVERQELLHENEHLQKQSKMVAEELNKTSSRNNVLYDKCRQQQRSSSRFFPRFFRKK